MSHIEKANLFKILDKSLYLVKNIIMTKEDFLKLAESRYDEINKLNEGNDFYVYEKEFVGIWEELGRQVFEKNLSEVGKDRRKKKKIQVSLGTIEVSKKHPLANMSLCYKISPYFQELQVYVGQQLDYQSAASTMGKLLVNAKVDDSQIHRLCNYYGNLQELSDLVEEVESSPEIIANDEREEITYVGVDGHFLLTDDGWEEVKLGRVFSSKDIVYGIESPDIHRVRNQIQHSNYLAHHGNCKKFIEKFDNLLTDYLLQDPSQKTKMVLLSDGAIWIDNWRKNDEIEWTAILDYYHVTEKLYEIANLFLSKEKKAIWAEQNCKLLLQGGLDEVLEQIANLESKNNDHLEKRDKLIKHFQKNRARMNYVDFINQGLYIGSGFIESAHKHVVQKRMKLSGQRWGSGMQGMLDLRCCSQSNKWGKVINIINEQCFKNAA